MSTTLSTTLPEMAEPEPTRPERLDPQKYLIERLPEGWRATSALPIFAAVLGVTFWRMSYRPLWHTDIWGHLAYGKRIWELGAIPASEPLLPLAAGVPLIDTAWLSQLLGFLAMKAWGIAALQSLFAATITLCVGLLMWRIYRRTGSVAITLAATTVFNFLELQQFSVGFPEMASLIRPQLAGLAAFCLLFTRLTGTRRRSDWWLIPGLIALWANLHGSFVMGLGLLGAFTLGRVIDVWRRTGSLSRAVRDPQAWRLGLLTELSAAAALLNPYGVGLYAEVLSFGSNPNLADLIEWQQLGVRSAQGVAVGLVSLVLMVLYRLSPRRVSATEVMLLIGLGAWTLWTSRMLHWWAVPAAYYFAVHASAVWHRFRKTEVEPAPRRSLWTAVTAATIWIFFAGSSFGVRLLHGEKPESARQFAATTPVKAVEFLKKNPPQGLVFNASEWGDYLLWAGPSGMQVFVDSHVHMIPKEVWGDYLTIVYAGGAWSDLLDRYGVNTVIVDRPREALLTRLHADPSWEHAYDDGVAVIYKRRPARKTADH